MRVELAHEGQELLQVTFPNTLKMRVYRIGRYHWTPQPAPFWPQLTFYTRVIIDSHFVTSSFPDPASAWGENGRTEVKDMTKIMMRVAVAAAAMFLLCGVGNAQVWGQRTGWGWQDRQDQREYQNGLRDGQNDRSHRRSWHPRHNERDYMNGYRAGYGQNGSWGRGDRDRDGDHDRDDHRGGYYPGNPSAGYPNYPNGRYPNGGYPNGGYPGGGYSVQQTQQMGYNNGYQEGLRYGQADRNNGHSNRPTYSSTYQNGSSGYSSAYGDKMTYKRAFQDGYRAGYQQGYMGGGYRR